MPAQWLGGIVSERVVMFCCNGVGATWMACSPLATVAIMHEDDDGVDLVFDGTKIEGECNDDEFHHGRQSGLPYGGAEFLSMACIRDFLLFSCNGDGAALTTHAFAGNRCVYVSLVENSWMDLFVGTMVNLSIRIPIYFPIFRIFKQPIGGLKVDSLLQFCQSCDIREHVDDPTHC